MENGSYSSSNQQVGGYPPSNQQAGGYSSSNQYGGGYPQNSASNQQTTTFSSYQPAPAYGSVNAPQQVYHSQQQNLFGGGYRTHRATQENFPPREPECCRII